MTRIAQFLPIRPSAPNHVGDEVIKRPRVPLLFLRDKKSQDLGSSIQEDEINARIKDAVSDVRNGLEKDFAQRMAEAESAAKEATTNEWTATVEAIEYNQHNELEEAREKHQIAVNDLKDKHQLKLKRAVARHDTQMNDLRDELHNLKSTVDSDKATMQELTATKLDLAGKLASCEYELGIARNQIQTIGAQSRQETQQGAAVLRQPQGLAGYNAGGVGRQAAMTWGEMQAREELAGMQEQFRICQEQFQFYYNKTGELWAAMAEAPGKTALIDGLLEKKKELCDALRQKSIEYSNALEEEKRERRLENANFSDAVDLAAKASHEVKNQMRYLEMSRDGLLKQIEELLQRCKRGITLNEFDKAFANHHEVVKKDNKELSIKVHSLEIKIEEMHRESNRLRMIDRQAEAAVPDKTNEILQLKGEIVRLTNDNETLRMETNIARQDQEKREPETWREVREKVLREKDDEIAALRLQLELDGGEGKASVDSPVDVSRVAEEEVSSPVDVSVADEEEVSESNKDTIWTYKRKGGMIFRDV